MVLRLVGIFPFITLSVSFHFLLSCRVSVERSLVSLLGIPLYVICSFPLLLLTPFLSFFLFIYFLVWLICILVCFPCLYIVWDSVFLYSVLSQLFLPFYIPTHLSVLLLQLFCYWSPHFWLLIVYSLFLLSPLLFLLDTCLQSIFLCLHFISKITLIFFPGILPIFS